MKKLVLFSAIILAAVGCQKEESIPEVTGQTTSSVGTQTASDTWVRKADVSEFRRAEAVAFSIGNKGYIGTGVNSFNNRLKDFWEYDPTQNVWTQMADVGQSPRVRAVGFSIGNQGYIGTGIVGSFAEGAPDNDFWQFDPSRNAWTQKAELPAAGRFSAIGLSINSKGYIGTGSPEDFVFLNDFYEYNPDTDSWRQRDNLEGPARSLAVGFTIAGRGYVGTGVSSSGNLQDFWEYFPATNAWTEIAPLPVTKAAAVAFGLQNSGYVGTGGTENAESDFYQYDRVANTWSQVANFAGGERVNAVGFSIGARGYVGTGYMPSAFPEDQKDFWEYQP